MANNPYVNKVVYGNNTLIDLTSDTVTADKLAQGYTAHDSSGAAITGTMSGANILVRDSADYTTSTQLQYNNIPAEPKAFAVIYSTDSSSRISTTNYYVTAVVYDGEETTTTASHRQSSYLYLGSVSESFTYNGTNHILLVKTNLTFHTASDYKLVYIY